MKKFTKGPWEVDFFKDQIRISTLKNTSKLVAITQLEANAHLIAAAPEMLTQLENCINELEKYSSLFPDSAKIHLLIDSVGAVISKAKGHL